MLPKIIAIIGPTASGKTACGVEIAREFDGEIIAVDSRTIYRGMNIGTAKPNVEDGAVVQQILLPELVEGLKSNNTTVSPSTGSGNNGGEGSGNNGGEGSGNNGGEGSGNNGEEDSNNSDGVIHWGIDLVDPNEEYTVSMFQKYAQEKISEILERGKLPILVGGSALWMDGVVDNLSFPEVEPQLDLRAELETKSAEDLFEEYKILDPLGADTIDSNNKRRLIRAIEVSQVTGKPFSELKQKGPKLYDALWLGMNVERETLDERISSRVGTMVKDGLVKEVESLKEKYGSEIPSMSGIGYRELCEHFDGGVTLEQALENIKTNTRRFARRQMTWWKRRKEIVWVSGRNEVHELIKSFFKSC